MMYLGDNTIVGSLQTNGKLIFKGSGVGTAGYIYLNPDTGSLGVGVNLPSTSNPGNALHVYGGNFVGMIIESSVDHPKIDFKATGGTSTITGGDTGQSFYITTGDGKISHYINNSSLIEVAAAASSGTTLSEGRYYIWRNRYWNGVSSNDYDAQIRHVMQATTGTLSRLGFSVGTSGTSSANEFFTILSNGMVGIGNINPTEKLTLNNGNVLLNKTYSIYWNDNSDTISVADNPTWMTGKQNTMTFKTYGASSVTGAFAWVDSFTNTLKMSLDSQNGNLNLAAGASFRILLAAPGAPTLAGSATGGSIAAGTYYYSLSVTDQASGGETVIGTESASVTTTGATSSVVITLPSLPAGAYSFKIYRTTVSGTYSTPAVIASGITTATYTDILATPSAGTPVVATTAYTARLTGSTLYTTNLNIMGTSNTALIFNQNGNIGFHTDGSTLYIGAGTGAIYFRPNGQSSGTNQSNIDTSGNLNMAGLGKFSGTGASFFAGKLYVGGSTTATALVHLAAGTATASTAPLKFTSGVNLSTTEAGAVEYDGTHLYFTASNGGTRYQLDQQTVGNYANTFSTKTGAYTVTLTDRYLRGDATTAGFSFTLPSAATASGYEFMFKKIDSSVNVVTIVGTIDGVTNYLLSTQYKYVRLISNGTNWDIVGNN